LSYFTDEFIPSRRRFFKHLFSKHPWLLRIRNLILGSHINFGVNFRSGKDQLKYAIKEGPDGLVEVFKDHNKIKFRFLRLPLSFFINVDEDFLREWVVLKKPLAYFMYYSLRMLPKIKLGSK
jgi:hypothetical protein